MTALRKLLTRKSPELIDDWFTRVAGDLLCRYLLTVNGHALRLKQIEFYWQSEEHPDPFAHAHPRQQETARWHFHRVGSGYRGGTRKGLDLTFGDGIARGGILFRAAVTQRDERIQGPSKLVDYLLLQAKMKYVADLDLAIRGRKADDKRSLLHLQRQRQTIPLTLRRKVRVGLSMKKATTTSRHADFADRLYFFEGVENDQS